MREKVKKLLNGPIFSSVCYLALGLVLVLLPVESVSLICKVVFSIIMVLAGAYHIVIHFWEVKNATILDLFSGVVLLVLGIFLFMNPLVVVKLFPVLLGSLVVVDSLWMLKMAFRLKKLKRNIWKLGFLVSLIFVGLGAVLIVNPFVVVKYMVFFAGGLLIANGLTDLIFGIILLIAEKKGIKQERTEEESVDLSTEMQEEKEQSETPIYEEWNSHLLKQGDTETSLEDKTCEEEILTVMGNSSLEEEAAKELEEQKSEKEESREQEDAE